MKLKKILQILLLLPAAAFAGPEETSRFVEPMGALTLQKALAIALTRSPQLAGFSYDLRAADARILQAKLFSNPEADFLVEDFGGSNQASGFNGSETTLALGQLIELGGKRRARVSEAKFDRELTGFDYETKKREVFLETHQLFVDVLAGQRRVGVNEGLVSLASEFLPAMEKRVEAGRSSAIEKTRFQVAVAAAKIELETARRELIAARYRLAAQWGASVPRFSSAIGDLESAPSVGSLDSLAGRLESNPRMARFAAERGRRSALLARERAAVIPDVRLRGGVRQQAATDSTGLVAGFSVPLPLFNRNQGAIRAASEVLAKTDADAAVAWATLRNELTNAYQALLTARTSIDLLRSTVLPGAREAVSGINEGFQLGRYSYFEVLDAQRTLSSAQSQFANALADYHKALAAIEAITADAPVPHAVSHSVR